MIVVKLMGGLGNQMFQYALGRHLSIKNKTELKLDKSFLSENNPNVTKRDYELDIFNIKVSFATKEEVAYFKKFERRAGHLSLPFKLGYFPTPHNLFVSNWKKYATEKQFHFDPDILRLEKDVYLNGWFNTEKYFKDIRNTLLDDFSYAKPLSPQNKEVADKISSSNSVSIHVRRGDYVTSKETSEYLGVCGIDYYQKAISAIKEKVGETKFFVFSDDIGWAKEHLPLEKEKAIYVNWNVGKNSSEDMRLMSLCKHNIIANSSFSWWAAWLSRNEKKNVIAPSRWFKNIKASVNTKDLIPDSWFKI